MRTVFFGATRGIGRALVDLVERSAASRGRSGVLVELNVHKSNEDAQAFYTKEGFVQTGETRDGLALVMARKN